MEEEVTYDIFLFDQMMHQSVRSKASRLGQMEKARLGCSS